MPRLPIALTLALVAGTTLTACSPARHAASLGDRPAARAQAEPLASLRALARRQRSSPSDEARALAPPPGLPADFAAAAPTGATAAMPLTEVLSALAERASVPAPAPVAAPDAEAQDRAARRYVAGRQALLSGDTAQAILDLKEATALDPASPGPWRELGEAYLAGGSRAEAAGAFRAAAARGESSPRVFELLGRIAADRQDFADAAAWYARAARADPERFDPVLRQVVYVGLSQALRREGYAAAATESLRRALLTDASLTASPRYAREAGEIFRRSGDLWREVGDDELRAGDPERALEAYRQAAALPSVDGQPLPPRVVLAFCRAGRPAEAALWVLEDLTQDQGRLGPASVSLLKHLAAVPGLGRAIATDLDAASAVGAATPTRRASMALAQSAVLGPADAAPRLREALVGSPGQIAVARALAASWSSPREAAADAAALAEREPRAAIALAEALVSSTLPLEELNAALADRGPSRGGTLVHAYAVALQGRQREAAELVRPLAEQPSPWPPAALAYADLRIGVGLATPPGLAQALIDQGTPDARRAAARVLTLDQRFQAAADALAPVIDAPPEGASTDVRVGDLLLAAECAAALGEADRALELLGQARRLDPDEDRPLAAMLALVGPGGPAASPARLNAILRELRADLPESRTARLLRARESLRRALLTQAEREALDLAAEDPGDAAAVDTAVAAWQRLARQDKGSIARGVEWLEARLARRPQSAPLLTGLAQLLVADDKAAQAETRLRAALDAGGGADVSRALERVLRDDLKRSDDAATLTEARLAAEPRSVPQALELAERRLAQRREPEAAAIIESALPAGVRLGPGQPAAYRTLVAQAVQRLSRGGERSAAEAPAPQRAAVLSMLAAGVRAGASLTPELHQARLALLTLETEGGPEAQARRLSDAAADAVRDHPSLRPTVHGEVSAALLARDQRAAALVFIERAARAATEGRSELYADWFRVLAIAGDPAKAREMLIHAETTDPAALREAVTRFADPAAAADMKSAVAEGAYILGVFAHGQNNIPDSDAYYEMALEFQPDHAWAANNLGYGLADRKQDLPRAERLLEMAYAAKPKEAPIIDSLGWVRYKTGVLWDMNEPGTGRVEKRGAVHLLKEAAETEHGRKDPTILDHAGDAHWLGGRFAEARAYWAAAAEQADAVIARSGRAPVDGEEAPPSQAIVDEAQKIAREAREKIAAADAGTPVKVAPQLANPEPRPRQPQPGPGELKNAAPKQP